MPPPRNLKLIIFDIDDTLHSASHFRMHKRVSDILQYLHNSNIPMAIASLNIAGNTVLSHYGVLEYFKYIELRKDITDCKNHFELREALTLHKKDMLQRIMNAAAGTDSTIKPENILFFDDCEFHINEADTLGIKTIKVDKNKQLQWSDLLKGFCLFN